MKKLDTSKREYVERLIHITNAMETHIEADAVAFRTLGAQILEANKDLKSLLATRSFLRGTWFAVLMVGTFLGVVAGLVIAWYR